MQKIKKDSTRSLYFPEHITEAMDKIFDYPITVVEAPMGYGKTTAVREYLSNSHANILWQRINEISTIIFWKGFCNQLCEIDDEAARNLIKLGFPNDVISRHEALNIIENIKFPIKTVLVIDDYHIIENIEVNCFIELLIQNEITNLNIILITRYVNFQKIDELKLKRYMYHIKKDIFEFSIDEIKIYYRLCGVKLDDSEADRIHTFTEGWISALYLLMLNYLEAGGDFSASNIYTLIEKTVYAAFSEEIKEFLLTMCIFDNFTVEQAIHMFDKKDIDVPKLLDEITTKNAFVRFDAKTKTYQMHNLFTNFLKDILEIKGIKLDLYSKAAKWFFKIGNYRLAIHYFYLCRDFENLYLSFEKEKYTGVNVEKNKELIIKYITECPKEIKGKHHFVLLILIFRLYLFNEIELFKKTCGEFMFNIESDKNLEEDEKKHLLGEYELVISFTAYNDIKKMGEHHRKAGELLTEPSLIMRYNSIWTFGATSILYMFYRESGALDESVEAMMEYLPFYSNVTNGNGSGGEYIMKSETDFYRGDFENAEILMHTALHKAQSKNQVSIIICAMFLEMRIALVKGDFNYILKCLKNMHDLITNSGEYLLMHSIEICEGYIYSLLKQKDKIPKWLEEGDFSSNRLSFPVFPMLNIVYGRVMLINGEYLKFIGNSEKFIAVASVFPNLLGQIHTYIYLAAANNQISREKDALSALKQALDIAIPDKVYMPFVENCDYVKPLLKELQRQGSYYEDISRILELYESYQKSVEQILKEHFNDSKPELSIREMEVAELAAQGLTNKAIGERLFISQNTVKTQLKTVFEKLGVNSRSLLRHYFDENF
jgi:LuxR family maltose regulon positive regulatory protein